MNRHAPRRPARPTRRRDDYGSITTEIAPIGPFYYAEDYYQQYLHKVPNGYWSLGETGVSRPVGIDVDATNNEWSRTDHEWRRSLSSEQYAVLREAARELPFYGEYVWPLPEKTQLVTHTTGSRYHKSVQAMWNLY